MQSFIYLKNQKVNFAIYKKNYKIVRLIYWFIKN